MEKLSFMDKINVLIEVSTSSKMFLLVLAFLFFLGIVFFNTNKKNNKSTKMIYLLSMLFIVTYLVITYHKSLGNMIDYLMNNLFVIIYFPNLAAYLAALVIMNVILLVSIFNYKVSKIIKTINITVYCVLNYILALILSVIDKYNLDVFSVESVYKNKSAQALIELSSIIFIVWILFLIVYKIIMFYLKKDYEPPVKKVVVKKKVRVLPDYINETTIPSIVWKPKVEEKPVIVPLTNEEKLLKQLDKSLTLEDYKILLQLLKEKKIREEKRKRHKDEFNELIEMYRNIN